MDYTVGAYYSVWWSTNEIVNGQNMALILKVMPYTGRYRDDFSKVLHLAAPNTQRGWLEMSVE